MSSRPHLSLSQPKLSLSCILSFVLLTRVVFAGGTCLKDAVREPLLCCLMWKPWLFVTYLNKSQILEFLSHGLSDFSVTGHVGTHGCHIVVASLCLWCGIPFFGSSCVFHWWLFSSYFDFGVFVRGVGLKVLLLCHLVSNPHGCHIEHTDIEYCQRH